MDDIFVHEHQENLLILLMRDEDRLHDVMGTLSEDIFNSDITGAVWKAISALARAGKTPTPELVTAQLKYTKTLDIAGGLSYMEMLATREIDASGFELYYNSVIDSYKRRILSIMSQRMPAAIHNNPNVSDIISDLQSKLTKLSEAALHGGVKSIDDLLISAFDIIKTRRESEGVLVGVTTGFPTIDDVTGGYIDGDVWIYSGRPSQGKTTALIQSFKLSAETGVPCLLFNREMSNIGLMFRFLAMDGKIGHTKIKTGQLSDEEMVKLERSKKHLSKLPIYLDSNYYGDISYITSAIRKYHNLNDIRLVGIDYVQILAERGGDQVAELGRISRELKLLAMDLGITIVILSQLNRRAEDREDKRPILSDLRQSGNLEEDADVVIGLYRDEYYNHNSPLAGKIEFIVLKQRNGPTGACSLDFAGKYLRIVDSPEFEFGRDNKS